MTNLTERTFHRLRNELSGALSKPGEEPYNAALAIWAKPTGRMPRAVAHCRSAKDVQSAIRAARDCHLPVSVRSGGHDWAGRSLCEGIVIDLSSMRDVTIASDMSFAGISGGARASDVLALTDPLGLVAVTGSCSSVGMTGLALGGGYGPLIGRFGLALDNLLAAEVVLADGRIVTASHDDEQELFWALRGGGGNFGVVTGMKYRVHRVSSVCSGMLLFPFAEANAVLSRCADIMASAPEELTVQVAIAAAADSGPVVMIVPTWSGAPEQGETRVVPFLRLGRALTGSVGTMSYGNSLAVFDPFLVTGQRVHMETCWLPALDGSSIDAIIQVMAGAVAPGQAIVTHEFRGAAARVPPEATAFGFRRDHVLVEIIAAFDDRSDILNDRTHRQWARTALESFRLIALPGGYPNLLPNGDPARAAVSYGDNADRLIKAKCKFDPDNVFNSAIPLPVK
jgi:FAD/FMN-containing dehydrogenase